MFTGIIDHTARIIALQQDGDAMLLRIQTQFNDLQLGESIAVDGICLTVTAIENTIFDCALSPETLRLTQASQYQINHLVNIERALRLQDHVGGHYVTGHVDAVLTVKQIQPVNEFINLQFSGVKAEHRALLVKKGSVTINGVSLTVNEVSKDTFSVMLIPHTLAITSLQQLQPGQLVNVEYDHMAKLVSEQIKVYLHKDWIATLCSR